MREKIGFGVRFFVDYAYTCIGCSCSGCYLVGHQSYSKKSFHETARANDSNAIAG